MDFSTMSGWDFERYCASLLLKKGFTKADVTSGSGDHGVDIIAEQNGVKFGVQCKLYTGPVPNKAVQEAYTGSSFYGCDIAAVLSNAPLTAQARQEAEKLKVKYWNVADFIDDDDEAKEAIKKVTSKDDIREKIMNSNAQRVMDCISAVASNPTKWENYRILSLARIGAPYVHYDDELDWLYCERICRSIDGFLDSRKFLISHNVDKLTVLQEKGLYLNNLVLWLVDYMAFIQNESMPTNTEEAKKVIDAFERLFDDFSDDEIAQINGTASESWSKENYLKDSYIRDFKVSLAPKLSGFYDTFVIAYSFYANFCQKWSTSVGKDLADEHEKIYNSVGQRLFPSNINELKYKPLMELLDKTRYKACHNNSTVVILNCDGNVAAFGDNENGECQANGWTNILDIACGANAVFGVREDGTVAVAGTYNDTSGTYFSYDGQRPIFNPWPDSSKVENWKGIIKVIPLKDGYYRNTVLGVTVDHKIVTSWSLTPHLNPSKSEEQQTNELYYCKAKQIDDAMEALKDLDDVIDVVEAHHDIVVLHSDNTATVCKNINGLASFIVKPHIWKNVTKLTAIASTVVGFTRDLKTLYSNENSIESHTYEKEVGITSMKDCPFDVIAKDMWGKCYPDFHKVYPHIAPWSKNIYDVSGYRTLYADGTMYAAKHNDYAAQWVKDNSVFITQGILRIDYDRIISKGYCPAIYICVREDGALFVDYNDESTAEGYTGYNSSPHPRVPRASLAAAQKIAKDFKAFTVVDGDTKETLTRLAESQKDVEATIVKNIREKLKHQKQVHDLRVAYDAEVYKVTQSSGKELRETETEYSEKKSRLSTALIEKQSAINKCGFFSKKKKEQLTIEFNELFEENRATIKEGDVKIQNIKARKENAIADITSKYKELAQSNGIDWDEVISNEV